MSDEEVGALVVDNGSGMCKVSKFSFAFDKHFGSFPFLHKASVVIIIFP